MYVFRYVCLGQGLKADLEPFILVFPKEQENLENRKILNNKIIVGSFCVLDRLSLLG